MLSLNIQIIIHIVPILKGMDVLRTTEHIRRTPQIAKFPTTHPTLGPGKSVNLVHN